MRQNHQVGQGSGKDLATIAGAAGSAYAGHKIEQKARSSKGWVVSVHFGNGENRSFNFESDPGYAAGDAVKLSGNSLIRRQQAAGQDTGKTNSRKFRIVPR